MALASEAVEPRSGGLRLRGVLGWVWSVLGPFLGLVLIVLLFAWLTRASSSWGPRRWG